MLNRTTILLSLLSLLLLTACRYEDGPIISHRSVHDRVFGLWYPTEFVIEEKNEMDFLLSVFPDIDTANSFLFPVWNFTSPPLDPYLRNSGMLLVNHPEYISDWGLSENKKVIHLRFWKKLLPDGAWRIDRLTNKEFWLSIDSWGNLGSARIKFATYYKN